MFNDMHYSLGEGKKKEKNLGPSQFFEGRRGLGEGGGVGLGGGQDEGSSHF